ncbi:hypothetical protein [Microvirga terrestris]|uniref:Uncharacterized protein n=1 Tax=Microvirga terrestris TaxID=2791024 RepID=A0ABS0HRD4_9HYPH|nr:hypothetical protein [Microvirga terrestris]MBF9196046.1 hypothetical protein [Microvirga terrestris]
MPVDLPPQKKLTHTVPASWNLMFDRSLNWLAVVVGLGLCLWIVTLGT